MFILLALYHLAKKASKNILTSQLLAQFKNMSLPRGVRNNNPLNIRKNQYLWAGEVPREQATDKDFKQFFDVKHGWKGAYNLLRASYIAKGQNTIETIVNKWAPPNENNTIVYIQRVEATTGINRKSIINKDDKPKIAKILAAMATVETGKIYKESEVLKYV